MDDFSNVIFKIDLFIFAQNINNGLDPQWKNYGLVDKSKAPASIGKSNIGFYLNIVIFLNQKFTNARISIYL